MQMPPTRMGNGRSIGLEERIGLKSWHFSRSNQLRVDVVCSFPVLLCALQTSALKPRAVIATTTVGGLSTEFGGRREDLANSSNFPVLNRVADPARPEFPAADLAYCTAVDQFDFAMPVERQNGLLVVTAVRPPAA